MIDKNQMLQLAQDYKMDISHCIDGLCKYAEILVDYNKKVNLTAITDSKGIMEKHFLDSLFFANSDLVTGKMVDVGTGAGFPGVVTKLYKPEIELTLMEPTGKRIDFLKFLSSELGLKDIIFAKERAEEAAKKEYREKFDIASARAVASMNVLSEYCLPLVKKGGYFIAMKADVENELQQSKSAIQKLGGELVEVNTFNLPDLSKRCLVVVKKISQTSPIYPRNGGRIAKKPL